MKHHTNSSQLMTAGINVMNDEGSRVYTINDDITEELSAYLKHEIFMINKTDEQILQRKAYAIELQEVECVDEEGEIIFDENDNPMTTFIEVQVTGEEYAPSPIILNFSTFGGSLSASVGILEAINNSKTPIEINFSENCMSGGTVISLAKCKKTSTEHCRWLVHNMSHSLGYNNLSSHRDSIAESEYAEKQMRKLYEENTTMPKKLLDKIFKTDYDYYFSAEEAKEFGFVSEVI